MRRAISMVTAALAMLGLGFVVAVASSGRPGGSDEPLLDLDLRAQLDLGPVVAWLLLFLAMVGAVLFLFGLRRTQVHDDGRRRSLLGLFIGLLLFIVLFRWLRPAAETLFGGETTTAADPPSGSPGDGADRGSEVWLLGVLLAAVVVAALARIGISLRTAPMDLDPGDDEPARRAVHLSAAAHPVPAPLGPDPRSRILAAYEGFETAVSKAGVPRGEAETTAHHAGRAGRVLGLDQGPLRVLVAQHARARYGPSPPSDGDAEASEDSLSRLEADIAR